MKKAFNESFGFVIHDVARLLRWCFDHQSQDLGLTRAQWSVLAHLKRGDGRKQKSLARLMEIQPITLTRHLDRLETNAWIERRDDPNDRRVKRVYLTEKANPMFEKLSELGQKVRQQALQGISAKEEKEFVKILLRMRENLSDTE